MTFLTVAFQKFIILYYLGQFKEKISSSYNNVSTTQLCLIFSGRILKDGDTLEQNNVKNDMTLHLVIKTGTAGQSSNNSQPPAPQPAPAAPSTGLSDGMFSVIVETKKSLRNQVLASPCWEWGYPDSQILAWGLRISWKCSNSFNRTSWTIPNSWER